MSHFIYTGSITKRSAFFPEARGEGIVVWRWDEGNDRLEPVQTITAVVNPTWFAIDAVRGRLHAVSELHDSTEGQIVSFGIDAQTGMLSALTDYKCSGSATCQLAVSADGLSLAWANYGTLPVGIEPDASVVVHRVGNALRPGVHPGTPFSASGRQDRPHAHCALFDPPRSRVLTTDLGLDALFATPLDSVRAVTPEAVYTFPPGSGPRHITALPDFSVFYVVHELSPRIDVLVPNGEHFRLVQSLEIGMRDVAQPAGITLSPGAHHLYASVRGTNEIRGFAVKDDGRLALPQSVTHTTGTPRDISFAWGGTRMLVAGQDDGEIRAYRYDAATGALFDPAVIARTGSPTCVRSLNIRKDQVQWPT